MCSILTEVLKELWIFVLYKPMYFAYEYVVGLWVKVVCISSMGLRAIKLSASTEVCRNKMFELQLNPVLLLHFVIAMCLIFYRLIIC